MADRPRRQRSFSPFPVQPPFVQAVPIDPVGEEVLSPPPGIPERPEIAPAGLTGEEIADIAQITGGESSDEAGFSDRSELSDRSGREDVVALDASLGDRLREAEEDLKRFQQEEEEEVDQGRALTGIFGLFDDSGPDEPLSASDAEERIRRVTDEDDVKFLSPTGPLEAPRGIRLPQEFVERTPPGSPLREREFRPAEFGDPLARQLGESRFELEELKVDPEREQAELFEEKRREEDDRLEEQLRDLGQAVHDHVFALRPRVLDGGVQVQGLEKFSQPDFDLAEYFEELKLAGIDPYIERVEPGDTFTVDQVENFVAGRIDPRTGIPLGIEDVNPRSVAAGLADIVNSILVEGIAKAIREGGTEIDISRAVNTAVHGIDAAGRGLSDHARQLLGRTTNLLITGQLKQLGSQIPSVGVNLAALMNRLGQPIFDELSSLPTKVDPTQRGILRSTVLGEVISKELNIGNLRIFEGWVKHNVKDPALQKLLETDVQNRIQFIRRSNRQGKQLRQTERPEQLRVSIENVPGKIVEEVKEERQRLKDLLDDEDLGGVRREARTVRENINAILKEHKVRDNDGKLIRVPIESGTAKSIVSRLDKFLERLFRGGNFITFITPGGLGSNKLQDSTRLLQELADALKKRTRFGTINELESPIDEVLFCSEVTVVKGQDGKYELIIQQSVSVECLLKLTHALLQEPGSLISKNGEFQIGVGRGTRKVGELIRFIQMLFLHNMGNPITITYKTRNKMGGHFVGGALRRVYEKPLFGSRMDNSILGMKMSMFNRYGGGVKVSDVSTGIAGVASGLAASGIGAPIALPVAAISGIISGLGKIFGF